jgi:Arm DNA-binding domain
MALTDTEIRKTKPMEKPYRLPDGGGRFLLVTHAGGKLWRWKYRFEGAEKLMPLGKYPEISFAQARERHVAARALLANGIDPMAKRKTDKTAKLAQTEGSFQNIASLWMEHWKEGTSPRHFESTQRRMEKDILSMCPISFRYRQIHPGDGMFQLRHCTVNIVCRGLNVVM